MSADHLLARLEHVKRTGRDRWMARCPAHADKQASLSVRELGDGRTLVHDFAGCSVEDILTAVGLDFDALYPERAVDYAKPRETRPYSVHDLVLALGFELDIATLLLVDVARGKSLAPEDRERAQVAVRRISKFVAELRNAR